MRILLDAHMPPRLGDALRAEGHDVLAAVEDSALSRMADEALLRTTAAERRIMVTHNVKHFVPIVADWGQSGQRHAGCILIAGIDHAQVARVLRGLRTLFEEHPTQEEWLDLALWLTPGSGAEPSS